MPHPEGPTDVFPKILKGRVAPSGGCQTGGAEEQWLSADLASHAGMPTIAVWHEPRWACTSDGHASDGDLQTFWAKLYDAHADFVFSGHNPQPHYLARPFAIGHHHEGDAQEHGVEGGAEAAQPLGARFHAGGPAAEE